MQLQSKTGNGFTSVLSSDLYRTWSTTTEYKGTINISLYQKHTLTILGKCHREINGAPHVAPKKCLWDNASPRLIGRALQAAPKASTGNNGKSKTARGQIKESKTNPLLDTFRATGIISPKDLKWPPN